MKKRIKRILLVFFLAFLMTGCTINYEVEIKNGIISEKVNLEAANGEVVDDFNTPASEVLISALAEYEESANKDLLKVENKSTNNTLKLKITGKQQSLTTYDKTIPKSCFNLVNTLVEDEQIVISTSEGATCFNSFKNIDNIVIKITTNHKVISENSDGHSNNTYTWNIDKNNYSTKSIQMTLNKNEYVRNNIFTKQFFIYLFSIIAIIVVIVGSIFLILKTKSDRNNVLK